MKPSTRTVLIILAVFAVGEANAQWVQTSLDSCVTKCLVVKDGALFAGTACSDGGVYRSSDNGTSWTVVNVGLPTNDYVNCFEVSVSKLFAGLEWGGVFVSTNDGTTWTQVNSGLTNTSISDLLVDEMNLFAATPSGGIFLSTNSGTTWTAIGDSLIGGSVTRLAATLDGMGGTGLWAVAYRRGGGVHLSTDGGTTWTATSLSNPNVRSFESLGNRLFAGASDDGEGRLGGVFFTANNGTSWTDVSTGLTNTDVWALAVSGTSLFAGTFGGVFLTTTNGTSWTEVNAGLMNTTIRSLAVAGTNLFVGTDDGVWRRPLSEMTTAVDRLAGELPRDYSLQQNYPNPFNPSTTIKFELPKSSMVRLSVFDILGREVSVLVNERRNAGVHEVKFDAAGLASGVYFYRMQAGSYIETKKLLLVR
jgi:photosystem II stability/assembly factor-like uncharacterized protein